MKDKDRRVYFFVNFAGGGELDKVFVTLYKPLNGKGFIVLDRDASRRYELKDPVTFQYLDFKYVEKIIKKKYSKIFYLNLFLVYFFSFFPIINKLKKIYKQEKVDYLITGDDYNHVLNILSGNHRKILTFHMSYSTSHSAIKEGLLKRSLYEYLLFRIEETIFKYFIVRLLYSKADIFIFVSKECAYDMIHNFRINAKKVRVIYNPINIDDIEKKSKYDLGKYEFLFNKNDIILNVARLSVQKGQWYLLKFLKVLQKKHKKLKLVILGDGDMKDFLVDYGRKLGLRVYDYSKDEYNENYDVYLLGFQDNPFKFISRSKLFLFPSFYEGLPMVLVEALASGSMIVSSDCRSGPREILAPDTDFNYETKDVEYGKYGILMPVLDINNKEPNLELSEEEKKWVEVIDRMLKDSKLRENYINLGKQRAKDFDIENIKKEWEKLFDELEGKK